MRAISLSTTLHPIPAPAAHGRVSGTCLEGQRAPAARGGARGFVVAGALQHIAPRPALTPGCAAAKRGIQRGVGVCELEEKTVSVATGAYSDVPSFPELADQRSLLSRRAGLITAGAALAGWAPALLAAGTTDAAEKEERYGGRKEVTLEDGLRYIDLGVGSGEQAVAAGDRVEVLYTSRLLSFNGKQLATTGEDDPFFFTVGDGGVIAGLSEMVVGMKPGGTRRGIIPAKLGYQSARDLPPVSDFAGVQRLKSVIENSNRDASLLFDVELIRVR
eukprot:CAMPEP_0182861024 /NCGR_PEP_ID=MMETSP0034_2-20130328/5263_1 /TAXON_ID=156128 /ORGANISM="Nephroselmis pyriformis, Strain CCMP717" /LENGTH=274 /DNA_ID=CAMNT_0024992911 /DNA_START=12 /DNA_END=836 /DNA_ORIENTATION=-